MLRRVGACLVVAAVGIPVPARAQETIASPISWTTHSIKSSALGTERTYYVSLPQGYESSKKRYPVLVLLDAEDQPQFVSGLANARFVASRNETPGLIVVGIPNGADRTHDLTPPATGTFKERFPTAGGADQFLAFISRELVPAVAASYRTLPTTVLAGHSLGGLIGLHAAAAHPGQFKGIIAMSPSLQWNDSSLVATYSDLLAKSTASTRLFVTHGGLEPLIDRSAGAFVVRLDSLRHPSIALGHIRYPESTHGMTPLESLVEGLRFIFQPVSLAPDLAVLPPAADSNWVVTKAAETESRYAAGARSLGLPEILPEEALNGFGLIVLVYLKLPGPAVAVLRHNVSLYPGSANVYDSLADALLAAGDAAGARANYEKAVNLAKATGDPILPESTAKLAKLKPAGR